MGAHAGATAGIASDHGDVDVDARAVLREHPPQRGARRVAQQRVIATGQHRRRLASERRARDVPDEVDAPVNAMQTTRCNPVF
ncbi:MAG: hypothetical protein QOJ85_4681, partial [Solirubrobacteraceae bacterium]|nr:hypothetical protein [Solirubrobacteraceae bacterium]